MASHRHQIAYVDLFLLHSKFFLIPRKCAIFLKKLIFCKSVSIFSNSFLSLKSKLGKALRTTFERTSTPGSTNCGSFSVDTIHHQFPLLLSYIFFDSAKIFCLNFGFVRNKFLSAIFPSDYQGKLNERRHLNRRTGKVLAWRQFPAFFNFN